jgi:transcriptional regulator with XRE-family HTH domain
MMTLAKRVRDFRYAKGWGPDELASRAEISRTALYQIESGKTELPRAGTLRRIAKALDVSIDVLLGNDVGSFQLSSFAQGAPESAIPMRSSQSAEGMVAQEASFARQPGETYASPESSAAIMAGRSAGFNAATPARERELTIKLHELLASPRVKAWRALSKSRTGCCPCGRVAENPFSGISGPPVAVPMPQTG